MAKCRSKGCDNEFVQWSTLQNRCPPCMITKGREIERKAERKAHRKAKENLKTWSQWNSEAQSAYNKVIRLLDMYENCISCNRTNAEVQDSEGWKPGGAWDCGHFKTRGAHQTLRFVLINSHKQCKSCNGGSGKYTKKNHTVGKDYRENLIRKIGLDGVEFLEGPQPSREYSIEDLKEIKQGFSQWARELEKFNQD